MKGIGHYSTSPLLGGNKTREVKPYGNQLNFAKRTQRLELSSAGGRKKGQTLRRKSKKEKVWHERQNTIQVELHKVFLDGIGGGDHVEPAREKEKRVGGSVENNREGRGEGVSARVVRNVGHTECLKSESK